MLQDLARQFVRLVRRNKRTVIAAVALLILLDLVEDLLETPLLHIDDVAYRTIVLGLRQNWLTPYMEQLSSLASPVVLFVMCLMIIAFAPGRWPGSCALLNLVLTVGLNVLLKNIVQRPRPEGFRLVAETGYSFPSGHSMVSMAFYGLVIWMIWEHYRRQRQDGTASPRDRRLAIALCTVLALVIVMVGVSRIYLGVHYASDVVAGFCVSLIWLAFYTKLIAPLLLQHDAPTER